jgi:uncharacterized protein (DUF1697 family)
MASEVGGLDPLHGYLKHGNLVVQMRFPYIQLESHAEKFIERKMTAAAPSSVTAKPQPVAVAEREPVMQVASQRKPPQSVQKKQKQQPAQVNEEHPYFE